MNSGLFLILIIFIILIILLGIIYVKRNKRNQNSDKKMDTNEKNVEVNKKHEDFLKSINIVDQERRTVIGKIYINGKEKEVSMKKNGNEHLYYLGDIIIGGYDPNIMGDNLIVFRENTLENQLSDQIKDQIVQVIKKDKKRKEQERERIDTSTRNRNFYQQEKGYQRNIGKKNEDLKKEKYIKIEKTREKNIQSELDKQLKGKQEKVENKSKDINIKQEVEMNTRATDMDTIGERLESAGKIKGKEKEGKLAFVESDDLDNLRDDKGKRLRGHTSRYEAVSIDKKGNIKALDLENDMQAGENPTERNYQVKQNDEIEKGDVLTRLKLQGDETIGIKKGKYGEVEVYHSHGKTIGGKGVKGNKSLDRQLETSNAKNPLRGTNQATLKLAQKYQDGYRSVEESYQEADKHENSKDEPCDKLEIEDIDGDPNTLSHNHIDDMIVKIMKNKEISDKFTEREVRERVEKEWTQKGDEQSLEDFKEDVEAEIEADAENMRGERGR